MGSMAGALHLRKLYWLNCGPCLGTGGLAHGHCLPEGIGIHVENGQIWCHGERGRERTLHGKKIVMLCCLPYVLRYLG